MTLCCLLPSCTMVIIKYLFKLSIREFKKISNIDSRQLDSLSETSVTSSGAPSTEDSMYVQGPVFGRRAERMMKASSVEWSDNSEDEYTVSVIIKHICLLV